MVFLAIDLYKYGRLFVFLIETDCISDRRKPVTEVCERIQSLFTIRILFNFLPQECQPGTLRPSAIYEVHCTTNINPYPTAFPYGNGMVLHFYQQQESSTTKTVHKVINKGLKTYV